MISQNAQESFDHLLKQSIKVSLLKSPEDLCDITVLEDITEIKETGIVVLTISSYLFRLIVLIYFTPDEATKAHFARLNAMEVQGMTDQSFYDAIGEFGNICCGLLNRDLGPFFPHIGMSTPNIIDKKCATYLKVLNGGYTRHFSIQTNDGFSFPVGLVVCDHADLDFKVDPTEESTATGELELF